MKGLLDSLEEGVGINVGWVLLFLGVIALYAAFQIIDVSLLTLAKYLFLLSPLILIASFLLFYEFWMYFVQLEYNLSQGRVTLEIRLPQEILKSPEAMELVLIQLHQVGTPDNHIQTFWDGKHPPKTSLEIVSRGGDIKFYLNLPRKKFKNIAETQLYAQYPGIEVVELPVDYTAEIPWDPNRFEVFSFHFGLKKDDALPIKTYVDFGLLTMPKEEEKVDPITSLVDALASIGPGEYYWVQILIDANRKVDFKRGALRTQPDWTEAARKYIKDEIIEKAKKRAGVEDANNVMMLLTETEKDTVKAIERSLGKNAFNTVIRGMYLATKDSFNPGERIATLITGWRAFDELNRNAIGARWRTDFDWNWWQDPSGKRRKALKKQELSEYKRRTYTRHSGADKPKIMTTEELATIFHLPGKVALTPSIERIPSTRAEAPANLPV